MASGDRLPTNLVEAIRYFSDEDRCFEFVKSLRWPDGEVGGPRCGTGDPSFLTTRRVWKCRSCRKRFSLKQGTIFEGSPLGFDKWLPAIWLIANSKNGISSHELGRALGVTQKSAWFMLHRIRLAMESGSFAKLHGTVDVDDTYVGGIAKNMHRDARARKIHGTGGIDKIAIQGARQRGGPFRAAVVEGTGATELQADVFRWVEVGSAVYTDPRGRYRGLDRGDAHKTVDHSREDVSGDVHINGCENFWMLFKRAWKGTHTRMNREHAHRYLEERLFSYNERGQSDLGRLATVLSSVAGRRLTNATLTGAVS